MLDEHGVPIDFTTKEQLENYEPPLDTRNTREEARQRRQTYQDRGFSPREAKYISGEGYILPAAYADEDPSEAALGQYAREEDRKLAERVANGEDISQPPAGYADERQKLLTRLTENEQFTPEKAERVVSIGHGYPETYNPHLYRDMLEARQAAEQQEQFPPHATSA
jgi:hypothetical protein